jgi:hypothetical protein
MEQNFFYQTRRGASVAEVTEFVGNPAASGDGTQSARWGQRGVCVCLSAYVCCVFQGVVCSGFAFLFASHSLEEFLIRYGASSMI